MGFLLVDYVVWMLLTYHHGSFNMCPSGTGSYIIMIILAKSRHIAFEQFDKLLVWRPG